MNEIDKRTSLLQPLWDKYERDYESLDYADPDQYCITEIDLTQISDYPSASEISEKMTENIPQESKTMNWIVQRRTLAETQIFDYDTFSEMVAKIQQKSNQTVSSYTFFLDAYLDYSTLGTDFCLKSLDIYFKVRAFGIWKFEEIYILKYSPQQVNDVMAKTHLTYLEIRGTSPEECFAELLKQDCFPEDKKKQLRKIIYKSETSAFVQPETKIAKIPIYRFEINSSGSETLFYFDTAFIKGAWCFYYQKKTKKKSFDTKSSCNLDEYLGNCHIKSKLFFGLSIGEGEEPKKVNSLFDLLFLQQQSEEIKLSILEMRLFSDNKRVVFTPKQLIEDLKAQKQNFEKYPVSGAIERAEFDEKSGELTNFEFYDEDLSFKHGSIITISSLCEKNGYKDSGNFWLLLNSYFDGESCWYLREAIKKGTAQVEIFDQGKKIDNAIEFLMDRACTLGSQNAFDELHESDSDQEGTNQ